MTINILLALVAFLGGWWMRTMWASLNELRRADAKLTEKVQAIEVLVAGNYVTKSDLNTLTEALFKKLDRIESKVDGKMDKHDKHGYTN
jgi:hypothetical protein